LNKASLDGQSVLVAGNGGSAATPSHFVTDLNKRGPESKLSVKSIDTILKKKFNFVKMDVEGHEVVLLSAISRENILETEFMLEIGTSENAKLAYLEIKRLGLNAFSQKNNWALVRSIDDLLTSHRERSLFLTMKPKVDWA